MNHPKSEKIIQALSRGLDILEFICCSNQSVGLQEIANHVALPTTTTHNLIKTLCLKGLVIKEQYNQYSMGNGHLRFGGLEPRHHFLASVKASLLKLQKELPFSISTFAEIDPLDVHFTLHCGPERKGSLQKHHQLVNPYTNACGLAVLAFADERSSSEWMKRRPFEEEGLRVWKTKDLLTDFLAEAKLQGFISYPHDAHLEFKMAFPIFHQKKCIGALGISTPSHLLKGESDRNMISELLAEQIRSLKP